MEGREAKDRLHEAFARTAKALSSPKRVALAEQLAQDEHTVEGWRRRLACGSRIPRRICRCWRVLA